MCQVSSRAARSIDIQSRIIWTFADEQNYPRSVLSGSGTHGSVASTGSLTNSTVEMSASNLSRPSRKSSECQESIVNAERLLLDLTTRMGVNSLAGAVTTTVGCVSRDRAARRTRKTLTARAWILTGQISLFLPSNIATQTTTLLSPPR